MKECHTLTFTFTLAYDFDKTIMRPPNKTIRVAVRLLLVDCRWLEDKRMGRSKFSPSQNP